MKVRTELVPEGEIEMTLDHNRHPWFIIGSKALACTLLIAAWFSLAPAKICAADSPDRPRRILLIPSYNFNYLGIEWFIRGTVAEFNERKPFNVTFSLENMQLSTHPYDLKYMDSMAASLKIKYSIEKPDLIIVQYKQALQFMERYGKEIFGDVPVVFAGLSVEGYLPERLSRNYTGIVASFSTKKNIELILQNHPDVKKIYVVGGSSPVEHDLVQEAIQEGVPYRGKVELLALNDMTVPALLAKLEKIEDGSAIMYQALQLDAAGKVFVPAQVAIEIARTARVPVYGMLDTYMGSGIVGGFLIHHEGLGRKAAEIAIQWLQSGVMPDTRVKVEPIGSYRFDWRQLKRWGIEEDSLPSGSGIEYKVFNIWDSYKKEIVGGICLVLLQAALIIVMLRNHYKRTKTEKELQESEESFRAIFERSSVGKSMTTPDGKLLQINKAFADMLGYTIEEIQQINFAQITHPDDVAEGRECIRILLAGEQATYRFEKRYIHKNGNIVCVDLSTTLLRDERGTPLYLITSVVDITERKQAEAALKKQLDLFERITETSPVGITLVDTDGTIRFANLSAENILGLTKNEITGRVYNDPRWHIVDESGGPFPEDQLPFFRVMNTGAAVFNVRHGIKLPDGRSVILSINAAPLKDDSDQVIGIVAALQDITEHKRMEEEILKADKLESVGILAGGIAHDFNNILTSISGNISMAKMQVNSGQKIFDLLSAAETASVRAQGLTRQLLTFAKGGTPVKETASIQKLIKEASFFVLQGSKSVCEFGIAEDLWPVEADLGQISQVISNIMINANQAMPEGGVIRITAENHVLDEKQGLPVKSGRYIRISIKDQGVGITEQHLSKIFDPYFTTKHTGSGLGLATAYSIINKHNGHISVESRLGAWTTFHIYLPASDKEIPVKEEVAMLTGSGRILMMDDDELLKELAKEMLDMLGYESAFAKEGVEAIEMYKKAMESEKPYDAVILDLTIPGSMGGKEVIKKLLEIDPEVKAIVFSGYSDDPVMSNSREYGFKGMMPKPFDFYSLGKVLNDVLNDSKSTKET